MSVFKFLRIILCMAILAKSQLIVNIIYSSFTNLELALKISSLLLQNFQSHIDFNLTYIETSEDLKLATDASNIVFGLIYSASLSELIKELAEEKYFIIASIEETSRTYSEWQFFIHNSLKNQIEALLSIVSFLNWETFIVVSDQTYSEDDGFSNYFSNKNYRLFYFSNSNDQSLADLFIGKIVQATGIRNIVILNRGESVKLLLKSLEKHNFLNIGSGAIIGNKGFWGLYGNGVVSYCESGLELADSYYNYEGLAFVKFLKQILSYSSTYNSLTLKEFLNKNTEDHHPVSNFTLINAKNNENFLVGKIFNGILTLINPLVYPGNSSKIPNSPTTDINI
ncbi:unnamed protein product [Blepharisma stoltei]|uniref:Receptor ligand binding region domain-containing protein n=1 Tax=Blepharisma stoltei TaxID=1481888 RepID=A0AAU9I720_9CILI|nr:unnamed protein product [Blepharisma stoltei]CAG9319395.1 unnamed protein product [Blepharisma stoltei]